MGSEGTGRVTYRAPDDGKVYVRDRNDDRIVYAGDVKRDELVTVDPDTNRVTVGSTVVSEKGLHKGNAHRIFFEGPTAETAKHTITTEERHETSSTPH
jgi:hypothetical protein